MAIPTKTNYVPRDYLTLRESLLSQLPLVTGGKWSDLNESDPGIAILELLISGIDTLQFYQDMQFNELYLPTVRQRGNLINLLRLIGYEVEGVRASKGFVTVSAAPSASPSYPVYVKKGAQFSAQGLIKTVVFTSTADTVITGPTDSKVIPVVQGSKLSETFNSDSSDSQKFRLTSANIDRSTVQVFVNSDPNDPTPGTEWLKISTFVSYKYDSSVFKVESDASQNVYVVFGDGVFGMIPELGSKITIQYIVTDGVNGNVGRNAISRVNSSAEFIFDRNLQSTQLSVVNASATAGGSAIESLEHAKETAIEQLFSLHRGVSRQDFAGLMRSIPGVDKAVAWGENEEDAPDYRLLNRVRCCFFSRAYADMYSNPSSRESYRALRDNIVRALLVERMMATTRLVFVDPVIVDIFVTLHLAIDTRRFDPNIVIDNVRFAITNAFSVDNVGLGQDVRISDVLGLVNDIEGVGWAAIQRLHVTAPNQVDGGGVPIPDTAPAPPQDIILEKWKLPTFTDTPSIAQSSPPTTVPAPYLQITSMPPTTEIGLVDIRITNPDDQTDVLFHGLSIYTGQNLRHITITYQSTTDEPGPQGGYYGNPNPESDPTTYASLE